MIRVTFTPDSALPADTQVRIYLRQLYDISGNIGYIYLDRYFTTATDGIDNIKPEVVSITPNDNAVDIGIANKVVMTFSESLDSSTVNASDCDRRNQ